jgi:hypothetical protein
MVYGILTPEGSTARQAAKTENQKAKGKNQKAKISAPGRGPDWGGIFRADRNLNNRQ